jgi:hypothetical protein
MSERSSAVQDRAVAIDYPPIVCTQPDDVAEVRALDGFRLFVRFFDGTQGFVELSERLLSRREGVFRSLADPEVFAQVGIEYGAVTWANGVDLAPDAMYEELKRNGVWVLR